MKLKEVAALLNGEISGDQDIEILGVAGINEAEEGEITFLSDLCRAKEYSGSKASAVIVRDVIPNLGKSQVVVKNPQYAFARLLEHFYVKPTGFMGVSEHAFVSKSAAVADRVSVYPWAYISDDAVIKAETVIFPGVFVGSGAVIGERCVVYPNVTVRDKVIIGNGVTIHPGAVIGSDGFGYVFEEGRHYKIPQVGGVII
jgi:UDP-3-O-[3-hydroxymyristoyl] glucosamine N-acyltransferase